MGYGCTLNLDRDELDSACKTYSVVQDEYVLQTEYLFCSICLIIALRFS